MERIERSILWLRDEKVILDAAISALYGVGTRVLVQAVKRNIDRFPDDFMFRLAREEFDDLRSDSAASSLISQSVTSKASGPRGGRQKLPYAFTEQGVAMLSSVLRSKRAVEVNVEIMRAFVRLRRMIGTQKELARKIDALERKYDAQFRIVFDAIRALMREPDPKKTPIGYHTELAGRRKKK